MGVLYKELFPSEPSKVSTAGMNAGIGANTCGFHCLSNGNFKPRKSLVKPVLVIHDCTDVSALCQTKYWYTACHSWSQCYTELLREVSSTGSRLGSRWSHFLEQVVELGAPRAFCGTAVEWAFWGQKWLFFCYKNNNNSHVFIHFCYFFLDISELMVHNSHTSSSNIHFLNNQLESHLWWTPNSHWQTFASICGYYWYFFFFSFCFSNPAALENVGCQCQARCHAQLYGRNHSFEM